jgi:DNA-binding Lrp family transcriptional regulator
MTRHREDMMPPQSDQTVARVIEALGDGLPLTVRPFADLGERLGLSEADVLAVVRDLRAQRAIVRIGAALAPGALGYHPSLSAVAVAEERVEEAADLLRELPYVTHVFELDDRYRLWYALATTSRARLEVAESEIATRLGVSDRYRVLPDEQFKATTTFAADGAPEPWSVAAEPEEAPAALDRDEQALVRLLQGEFPLAERPFSALAITLGECGYDVDERWALDSARELSDAGVLGGFEATLRTRPEPWRLALTTWLCPGDPQAAGEAIASFPEVLHCFTRRVPGAGMSVLALVEADDRAALDQSIARIAAIADLDAPRIACPVTEFKRTQLRFFAEGE